MTGAGCLGRLVRLRTARDIRSGPKGCQGDGSTELKIGRRGHETAPIRLIRSPLLYPHPVEISGLFSRRRHEADQTGPGRNPSCDAIKRSTQRAGKCDARKSWIGSGVIV
jgi:hypothetical protein